MQEYMEQQMRGHWALSSATIQKVEVSDYCPD